MKKKRGLNINIHFTNRWLYTLVAIGIILIIGAGVYAASSLLTPGIAQNPGHTISQTSPPSSCSAGQILQWNGTSNADGGWVCITPFTANSICPTGLSLKYNYVYTYNEQQSTNSQHYDGDSCAADTCNGDNVNKYTCASGESRTCQDAWGGPTRYNGACWHQNVICTATLTSTTATPYCS